MPTSKQLPSIEPKILPNDSLPFQEQALPPFLLYTCSFSPLLFFSSSSEFGRVVFSPFSLFSPLYLAIPSPRLPTPAIYIGPADSEAVSRNKSRLLYKCCQQNRNIAFAYQLFAVQFTRASGGRQNELGTTTENERRRGRSREIVKQGLGEGLQHTGVVLVHVANKLTTAAGRWHLYYDLLQLPA